MLREQHAPLFALKAKALIFEIQEFIEQRREDIS